MTGLGPAVGAGEAVPPPEPPPHAATSAVTATRAMARLGMSAHASKPVPRMGVCAGAISTKRRPLDGRDPPWILLLGPCIVAPLHGGASRVTGDLGATCRAVARASSREVAVEGADTRRLKLVADLATDKALLAEGHLEAGRPLGMKR